MGGFVSQRLDLGNLCLVQMRLECFQHAQKRRLGRVGDERKHRVRQVAFDGLQDVVAQLPSQGLALAIYIAVATPAEIDALERTGLLLFRRDNLFQTQCAAAPHVDGLSGLEFMDLLRFEGEHGLYDRTFGSHDHHLVIRIPKGGTDAPRVTHGKHLAAAREPADDIAAVPRGSRRAQHIVHIDMLFYVAGDVRPLHPVCDSFGIKALAFAVEPVPHLFQHDVSVRIDARVLSLGRDFGKHLVHVRQVEVPAKGQVRRPPIVAAQERVHERNAFLAGCGITQVPHIQFAGEWKFTPGKIRVREPVPAGVLQFLLHDGKNFSDSPRSQRTFAEHVFLARRNVQLHASQPRAFLSSVVLFFHQQVKLVQPEHPRAIFLRIVFQRLQQAYHRDPALMLQLFHPSRNL